MELDYLKIAVTIILAVIGWIIGHYFTTKRDVSTKRREVVLNHLIDAYRTLANDVSHRNPSQERDRKIEDLVSDIQLFGTNEQIEMAKALADEVAAGGVFEVSPLLVSLRDDLRAQLNLSTVEGNVRWLRFDGPKV